VDYFEATGDLCEVFHDGFFGVEDGGGGATLGWDLRSLVGVFGSLYVGDTAGQVSSQISLVAVLLDQVNLAVGEKILQSIQQAWMLHIGKCFYPIFYLRFFLRTFITDRDHLQLQDLVVFLLQNSPLKVAAIVIIKHLQPLKLTVELLYRDARAL